MISLLYYSDDDGPAVFVAVVVVDVIVVVPVVGNGHTLTHPWMESLCFWWNDHQLTKELMDWERKAQMTCHSFILIPYATRVFVSCIVVVWGIMMSMDVHIKSVSLPLLDSHIICTHIGNQGRPRARRIWNMRYQLGIRTWSRIGNRDENASSKIKLAMNFERIILGSLQMTVSNSW